MAIQEISEFKGDPWIKQEEESSRAYHYFKQYKKSLKTRDDFIEFLCKEADERYTEGAVQFLSNDAKYNTKNQKEIQKYNDTEGKKGICPRPAGTIEVWFQLHKWFKRRTAYWDNQEEEADATIQSMVTQEKVEMAEGLIENIKSTSKKRLEQKKYGEFKFSQDEAGSKSINNDIDSLNKLSNNDTQKVEATVTSEVNADVNVKRNFSEDLILNPKYAELARELRKEVLDGERDRA